MIWVLVCTSLRKSPVNSGSIGVFTSMVNCPLASRTQKIGNTGHLHRMARNAAAGVVVADANGNLADQGIRLNNNLVFSDFNSLHAHIRGMVGDDAGPGSAERVEELVPRSFPDVSPSGHDHGVGTDEIVE